LISSTSKEFEDKISYFKDLVFFLLVNIFGITGTCAGYYLIQNGVLNSECGGYVYDTATFTGASVGTKDGYVTFTSYAYLHNTSKYWGIPLVCFNPPYSYSWNNTLTVHIDIEKTTHGSGSTQAQFGVWDFKTWNASDCSYAGDNNSPSWVYIDELGHITYPYKTSAKARRPCTGYKGFSGKWTTAFGFKLTRDGGGNTATFYIKNAWLTR